MSKQTPRHSRHKTPFPLFSAPCSLLSVRSLLPVLCSLLIVFLASCAVEPGPLYGTWADNKGDTFSFFEDNTFTARIPAFSSNPIDGNYSLLLNSLTLDCKEPSMKVVTEWDIRGNILYLNWTSPDGGTLALTLFKISN